MVCICDQCADEGSCAKDRRLAYGRACWLALNNGQPAPSCEHYTERTWVYRRDWQRGDRLGRVKHGCG